MLGCLGAFPTGVDNKSSLLTSYGCHRHPCFPSGTGKKGMSTRTPAHYSENSARNRGWRIHRWLEKTSSRDDIKAAAGAK